MKLRTRSARRVPGALSSEHRALVDRKRAATLRLVVDDAPSVNRIATAPAGYLLAVAGSDVVRHAALLEPLPVPGQVRVVATPGRTPGAWHLDVATRDRAGLLAAFTGVLAAAAVDVTQAVIATWPDGAALQALVVRSDGPPDTLELVDALTASLDQPLHAPPVADARITFDQHASAVYTACQVEAPDSPGLLHAIASAIAATRTDIHAAGVATCDGTALDRFDLSDHAGGKLDTLRQDEIRAALSDGVQPVIAR